MIYASTFETKFGSPISNSLQYSTYYKISLSNLYNNL